MRSTPFAKIISLGGIVIGLVIFAVGAAFLSAGALVGIGLSAFGAIAFTWVSNGQRRVLIGLSSGIVGAVVAWVAMRSMMRWVAVSSGLSPVLTLEGTSAILGTSLLMSILPGMGYVHFRSRYGPSFRTSIGYGVILSAVGGLPILLLVAAEISSIAREPIIPISFLLGVPVLFSIAVEGAHRLVLSHWS